MYKIEHFFYLLPFLKEIIGLNRSLFDGASFWNCQKVELYMTIKNVLSLLQKNGDGKNYKKKLIILEIIYDHILFRIITVIFKIIWSKKS